LGVDRTVFQLVIETHKEVSYSMMQSQYSFSAFCHKALSYCTINC